MGTGEAQPRAAELAVGRRWTFGPAVLDERSLELTVHGELVRIERKPLEVLLYLLHHAGEVVTKDELADNLWPGRILTETVLTRCISQLRQVLKDEERTIIRTAHGYGYRLVAEVKIDATKAPAPPAFSFEAGQQPPLRPHWRLVERLGTGGHGEAWLAEQDKTRDRRVFKFALDASGLAGLKREITLYRLLNDTLGDRAPAVRLLEWNLEEGPYFIETEYIEGRDLSAWAAARGGLGSMTLEQRLDLIAQVAEALAAAHSVGVLHKDLKPGNVLVCHSGRGEEPPRVKLSDFGSGGVLDDERLEKLGITRLGFTKTAAPASATPLYVAPEVIAGQPSTVSADIYALGVMLYQAVVGDFRKALAPGWELDVQDELLREDIAAAAAGDPSRRLADAMHLAERLRTLEARRETRAAEIAARDRAERARKNIAELRRARVYASVLLLVAALALTGGFAAYKSRGDALAATATAEALSGFLMDDVLRVDSGLYSPSGGSFEALLSRAASEVGARLKEQPSAAANIRWLLGRRFQEIGKNDAAIQQYEVAARMFTDLHGEAADPTLMALDRLAWVYLEEGRSAEALAVSKRVRQLWESRLRPTDLAMFMVRTRIARIDVTAGELALAEHEIRAVIREVATAEPDTRNVMPLLKHWLGIAPSTDDIPRLLVAYAKLLLAANVLEEIGDNYQEAELLLREALETFSATLSTDSQLTALANFTLASVLASAGKTEEAQKHSLSAQEHFDGLLPIPHFARGLPRVSLGRIRIEQQRPAEAAELFQDALDFCELDSACPPRLRAEILWDLAVAYSEQGLGATSAQLFKKSLALQEHIRPHSSVVLRTRVGLAIALQQAGMVGEARSTLGSVSAEAIARLKPYQTATAELKRAEGLIALAENKNEPAQSALKESLNVFEHRLGASHWRTMRSKKELAKALQSIEYISR